VTRRYRRSPPRRVDARAQRRLGYDTTVPDGGEEVVLRHDTVSVTDQKFDEIEDLRFDGYGHFPAPQFAPAGIECIFREAITHAAHSPRSLVDPPQTEIKEIIRKSKPI
jgi:hypothetical protein